MPRLTIRNPAWADADGPVVTRGTEILLDGKRVERVVGIDLHIGINDVVRADIEVLASPDEIDLPADVTVIVHEPEA